MIHQKRSLVTVTIVYALWLPTLNETQASLENNYLLNRSLDINCNLLNISKNNKNRREFQELFNSVELHLQKFKTPQNSSSSKKREEVKLLKSLKYF